MTHSPLLHLFLLSASFSLQVYGAYVSNSLGMHFVRIEPGTFLMGSEKGDWDERPPHRVTLRAPFFMSVTEVTNAQYEKFDPKHRALRGKMGFSKKDNEAVVFVTWHQAAAFCRWLWQREGKPYRLPTEAEWEYACRAGTTTAYSTGDSLPTCFHKNQRESWYPAQRGSGSVVCDLTVARTPPNAWGLFDMHGNVEEWCHDWYGPYDARPQIDPVGRRSGDFKVTRGGSHSTEPRYLRSANRSGTLPEDASWLIGFRVLQAPLPPTASLPPPPPPRHQRQVDQTRREASFQKDPTKAFFKGPVTYVKIPPGSDGPLFSRHNHCPAIVNCPNGDLLAVWYTCRREPGRELGIAASRLRWGKESWEEASPFWDAPDRNDHAPALWVDEKGTLYHFNGLSAAATWGNLATVMRTSADNGATWSPARLILPEHGLRHMPVETILRLKNGAVLLPCDATHRGSGGTVVYLSCDNGKTWVDLAAGKQPPQFAAGGRGAWIAGIHAPVAELTDGRLIAFGRGDAIGGRMPMSISEDGGRTWTYHRSPFPPIGGGQRPVLLRLKEGPLLFCSFGKNMLVKTPSGQLRHCSGLFAALSFDGGRTWPTRRLVAPGGPPTMADGGGNTGRFLLSGTTAEPRGYLSVCQGSDGTVHLITSKQYYAFNYAWLTQ